MIELASIIIYIAAIIGVVAVSLMGKIHLGLLFLIPLFPLRNIVERMHQFPLGKDIIDIILLTMILGWSLAAMSKKEKIFQPSPFNKILFVMFVYTYLSVWKGSFYIGAAAPVTFSSVLLQNWKNYMILPLLYFITFNNIKNIKQMKWLVIAIVFSMLLMDYYTVRQIRWMSGIMSRVRIKGTFESLGANEVAAFYAMYTFVLLGIIMFKVKKFFKLFIAPVIACNLFCILFLYSRGAYVAVLASSAFLGLVKNKFILAGLLFIALFWNAFLPENVIERIRETQNEGGELDNSSQDRLELWEKGMNMFKRNPLIGAGYGVVSTLGFSVQDREAVYRDTHNIYVKILAEQGIIGIIILVLLFRLAFKSGWQLFKSADDDFLKGLGLGFAACVIAAVLCNFFGDRWTYHQVGAYFWVFLALVVRGNIITEEQLSRTET
ncbi:O-antigen ligase family protein [Elusimicrobiota bacterium]